MRGRVKISGAKNAVLPIIAATLLGQESPSMLDEVPALEDVYTITEVLKQLGFPCPAAAPSALVPSTSI